uniref:Translocon-associated protein alpha subunit n=1 Tax=Opalinidae sp. TaxID=2059444 RepID=A0A649UZX3_9STRA|nr:translocon-associated protein alpha subunit [Opalinidae sp.]
MEIIFLFFVILIFINLLKFAHSQDEFSDEVPEYDITGDYDTEGYDENDDIDDTDTTPGEKVPINRPHPLTDIPEPSPDVTYYVHFPDFNQTSLPLGSAVTVLVGLVNNGKEDLNISFVMGSLNKPEIFQNYIQNFTKRDLNTTLRAYSEITIAYRFATYYDLLPNQYRLCLSVFYDTQTEEFATTFINETIDFYEKFSGIDYQLIYSLLLLSIAVGALSYIYCFGKPKKVKTTQTEQKDLKAWLDNTLVKGGKAN